MPEIVTEIRHARYDESGNIHAEMKLPSGECWMDIVVMPHDPDVIWRELFAAIAGGQYGAVTPWRESQDMLEKEKEKACDRINIWRNEEENKEIVFEWQGRRWDAGKRSLSRLEPVLAVTEHLPERFFWTDADNHDVAVDADELKALGVAMKQAMVAHGFRIHERQRQMKQEIAGMTRYRDVLCYQPGWGSEEPIFT
ncbi:TPA: DUF4376 domain-containing protein [Escherichia coli]|uniref:DUF4376 domain-containing protein n=1 Tax=Escherichia coli TaxID=562 RepID=UPI001D771FE2|nr:DUF4376 domain-containing protein [Escherichia coli]EHK3390320.1 DUF4376 domain-containing protein [Escherichia coli]EHK3444387.1 DUF4376 domain-containing protein [Escherichia coli]EHK5451606.1 DUF4376 domain-containing protein [Escherichia coli]EIF8145373.1 DUF4376 domain-containing protein [Escherichia coli]EIG2373797.1 DUF4376 domain-containing protein [Escherichia coli]